MKKALILIITTLLLVLTYFVCDNIRLKKIDETKKANYNEVVKTEKEIKLYNKDYKEIGSLDIGTKVYLEKTDYKNDYYKLLDEEYYIYYENIKPVKEKIEEINYLPFNTNLITTNEFVLDKIKINETKEFNVYLKKEGNYIKFNNQLFKIDEKYIKEEKEVVNGEYTDSISILNLINYDEEQLELINDYNMIDNNKYSMWKNNEIVLPNNTILLVSEKEDELFKKI